MRPTNVGRTRKFDHANPIARVGHSTSPYQASTRRQSLRYLVLPRTLNKKDLRADPWKLGLGRTCLIRLKWFTDSPHVAPRWPPMLARLAESSSCPALFRDYPKSCESAAARQCASALAHTATAAFAQCGRSNCCHRSAGTANCCLVDSPRCSYSRPGTKIQGTDTPANTCGLNPPALLGVAEPALGVVVAGVQVPKSFWNTPAALAASVLFQNTARYSTFNR